MKPITVKHVVWVVAMLWAGAFAPGYAQSPSIPEPLQSWQEWSLWGVEHRQSPKLYSDGETPIDYWPSRMELTATEGGGKFTVDVEVFEPTWVALPGSPSRWPLNVRDGDDEISVLERDKMPAIKLAPGKHTITGEFRWTGIPEKIAVPNQIGVLNLVVDGEPQPQPRWDRNGEVWLKRARGEVADKDGLSLQIYRLIEDGIPIWLRTEIELTVSGKSREEELGWVMPEGWRISTVESPIPVAVDERGVMKAQVRAGKWTIKVHAFRTQDAVAFQFATDADVAAATELIGFKADPSFRVAQLEEIALIDVSQTTFPQEWKAYPVYLWDTSKPFRISERMRGMGDSQPAGLTISRLLWLDEDGTALTYEDRINGQMQQIWRLDVAAGHTLGAVRVDDEGQLITENPTNGSSGVEIRKRDLKLAAVGRIDRTAELAATGWQVDADSLEWQITLPPGWRALAVLGADDVNGDWLTAWSLLDLFLLLVFSFAVYRMHGLLAGVIALAAFALSYHEWGAPRFVWLMLLVPLALERVVPEGSLRKVVLGAKFFFIAVLLLILIPFVARQLQCVIYPQLESQGMMYVKSSALVPTISVGSSAYVEGMYESNQSAPEMSKAIASGRFAQTANLNYDPKSIIQTGPARPRWDWNAVTCRWNGPVSASQTVRPILISLNQHRLLSLVRVALLLMLAGLLLRAKRRGLPSSSPVIMAVPATAVMMLAMLIGASQSAHAQIPDEQTLQSMRDRLTQVSDAFPNAAEIPMASLSIDGNTLKLTCEIHATVEVAVPLPGRLPSWSPVAVTLDENTNVAIVRRDDYLWVLVPEGVHTVKLSGRLPEQSDLEWTYALRPRHVTIDAPGWKISGLAADGTPDQQIFLSKEQAVTADSAAYDRSQFNSIVVVDRYLEVGILTKVHTTVTRLGAADKAVSLVVPLIEGERVLTSNRDVNSNTIAVRLAATDASFDWDSELTPGSQIALVAAETQQYVERWHLVTSPVWNVQIEGANPVYESSETNLVPIWHPWPGEQVTLTFTRPTAVAGEAITVQSVEHEVLLGDRRRNLQLQIELECSLATDFAIDLGPEVEVTSMTIDGQSMPVQRSDSSLIVPAKPGKQTVVVQGFSELSLQTYADAGQVTLPVAASNVTTQISVPESRWVLWAEGPLRGPAVRFWTILAVAILAAIVLSRLPRSPLRIAEWMLLTIGLTQVPVFAGMFVVGWLFLLGLRGSDEVRQMRPGWFNTIQVIIVMMTFISLLILTYVVSAGLLGHPDMFILGNGSTRTDLRWFQPRSGALLPVASVVSISVWFYRLLMLLWALWLATALVRWLVRGWQQFSTGGYWKTAISVASV